MPAETCSSCRFWRSGTCRRFPPAGRRVWPQVDGADWCGEHRPGDRSAPVATHNPRSPRGTLMAESRRRIVEKAS